jgi:hypothetical protein
MGGTVGPAPAAITMLRVVSRRRVPSASVTSTSQGLIIMAWPCSTSTPSCV